MEASSEYPRVTSAEGYAVGHLDDLGDGPGFRKIRKELGVTAFGVNAIVLPAGIETGFHYKKLHWADLPLPPEDEAECLEGDTALVPIPLAAREALAPAL